MSLLKNILVMVTLLAYESAYARPPLCPQYPVGTDGYNQCVANYNSGDNWQSNKFDTYFNVAFGYSVGLTVDLALERYFGFSVNQAALWGTLITTALFTVGEMYFDEYFGRADVQQYAVGAAAAGITLFTFRF